MVEQSSLGAKTPLSVAKYSSILALPTCSAMPMEEIASNDSPASAR